MTVLVQPSEIWEYFQEHKKELEESYLLVASDDDGEVEIYLTEENGMPYFRVEISGQCESEADSISKINAEGNYRELISLFIEDEYGTEMFSDDEIDRLNEIQNAAEGFLMVLLGCSPDEACMEENEIDEVVDRVEEFLYEECGIPVWHPTIVDDETTGEANVVQYPYGEDECVTVE